MNPVVFILPGNETFGKKVSNDLNAEIGEYTMHRFPDGESYVRVLNNVEGKDIIIICTLHKPDEKFLPLFFLCKLLKDLKAKQVILVAPYLAYMRQDKRFNDGEAITSNYFASAISLFVDKLITVDPHLHRINSLTEIYSVPAYTLHAADHISEWIKNNVKKPILIGPDSESAQWISEVANKYNIPYVVLEKKRKGDSEVEVSAPHLEKFKDHTPVLLDDIISTQER